MTDPVLASRPTRTPPLLPQPADAAWPTNGWPTASMPSGVDETRWRSLFERGFGAEADPVIATNSALVAVHRGVLVAEAYGPETDADSTLISWSMAKSITHAMVGMLSLDGLLDVDASAPVPAWADDERRSITTRQLLRMCSGLEFVEDYVDDQISHVIEMLFGAGRHDVAEYAASFPLQHEPGTVFNYASGTTNIVSAICTRVLGGSDAVADYLQTRLFEPLGMTSATAKFDDAGTFIGSSFVYATARDFARFGYLYLRDGVWDGQRLLPEGWIDAARTPVEPDVFEARWYGEHWWIWDDHTAAFACQGYEGQFIVVVPDRDLVIVRLGKTDVSRQPELRHWLTDLIDCFPSA